MRKNKSQSMVEKMCKDSSERILYTFANEDTYLEKLVDFISKGLVQGEYVLIVESRRNIPLLRCKLESILNEEEQSRVQFVNNYDYFFLNGSLHPSAIYNYFASLIGSLKGEENNFRTWMHVEWGHEQELISQIEEFEANTDEMTAGTGITSVYAYNSEWLSRDLKTMLQECHTHHVTDWNFLNHTQA
ncbi:MEDS domain-containing protein [Evansella clarkii]|jgi:hypothetical protein|uniref:MEDS domain-containing protein n=1 Tax=Evansella clarkii TaxID=79879 RepID=UPI000B441925|nr:MEDS domain-containing protein [Evansella clarkii]